MLIPTLQNNRQDINPHKRFKPELLEEIFNTAKEHSSEIYALSKFLHNCALRIQDAVGLKFAEITKVKANKEGFRKINLVGKKTSGRPIIVDQETVDAILIYQKERKAGDDDVMFQAGDGVNPSDKWV